MSGAASLRSAWAERGIDPATLAPRADGTIAASERRRAADTSATLASDPGESYARASVLSPQALALGGMLGRGGMGEVRLADQIGLRRSVAVKTALDARDAAATAALLKEAWVGAALEHPSVVPVHTLAATPSGAAIVMKRIEGRPWSEVLAAREGEPGEPSEADLRVVARVCHAIAFAHSRGILHLDLKPENVMLGEHGEVYVLDWGLAVAHGEGGPPWLPSAASIDTVAGTPMHMAPELAAADGARIGPRTDVYLIGALLHQVITGRPLHDGATLVEVLLHAYESPPAEYDAAIVPEELAAIVHRATHRDPESRFPSAEALREAIEAHLHHRRAERFARAAQASLAELDAILAREGTSDVEIEPRLAEIELAIEQARRGWAEHPALPALDDAVLERRVRQAIRAERPEAAARVLARMRSPRAELAGDVEALRARADARARRLVHLEELRRELDVTLADRDRRRTFMLLGAAWALVSCSFGPLTRAGLVEIGYRELAIEAVLLIVLLGGLAARRGRALFVNRANRRLWGGMVVAACTVELFWVAAWALGVPSPSAIAATLCFYVYAFATLGLVLDRRMLWGAIPLALAGAVAALAPQWVHEAVGLGGGAAVAAVLLRRSGRVEITGAAGGAPRR